MAGPIVTMGMQQTRNSRFSSIIFQNFRKSLRCFHLCQLELKVGTHSARDLVADNIDVHALKL